MSVEHTIAFIGAGNMAGALIRGLVRTATVPADQIIAADPDAARREALEHELDVRTTGDNAEAIQESSVVILATKPQVFREMLPGVASALQPDTLLISVAAGIPTRLIERALPEGARVVRTMPNTPALVGAGATAIAGGGQATEEDLELAEILFRSVGISVRVPEGQLDAVTGLSGSGPAYVFAMVEALRDAGMREGLSEEDALKLASQTVFGASRLLRDTKESPGVLRERVTSPGGTTRAGLDALEAAGFSDAVIGAVRAATRRSVELGRIAGESES
ncbi:MAG: pyrroline-5-carboxylate reductase [Polyangiales bacterium]